MVQYTSVTSGTGTLTLTSVVAGYQSWANAGIANNTIVSYGIADTGPIFEVGSGTYITNSSGTFLLRTTVRYSSNATSPQGPINCTGSNTVVYSTMLDYDYNTFSPANSINLGTTTINLTGYYSGNSTANTFGNSTIDIFANSTSQTVVTPVSFSTGNSTANSFGNSIMDIVANSTSQTVITPVSFSTGNSSVNTTVNTTAISINSDGKVTMPDGSTWSNTGMTLVRYAVADVDYSITAGISIVAYTSITATRVVTLAAASSYNAGQQILIIDESGSVGTSGIQIVVGLAAGSIYYNGNSAGNFAITSGYGSMLLESTGTEWIVLSINPDVVTTTPVTPPACGRLVYSNSTYIIFKPFNGDIYKNAGTLYRIPSAGIGAYNTSVLVNGTSGQNLAASTLYYVAVDAGVLSFWTASTHSHLSDTTTDNIGVEVISSSGTPNTAETLIGMVYTTSSGTFQDACSTGNGDGLAAVVAGVASWFNRRTRTLTNSTNGTQTTNVTSITELESVSLYRVYFLSWADDNPTASTGGIITNTTTGDLALYAIGVNGTSIILPSAASFRYSPPTGGDYGSLAVSMPYAAAEGINYFTHCVWVTAGDAGINAELAVSGRI